jgi:SagB-type dehydrogenase family enzyme
MNPRDRLIELMQDLDSQECEVVYDLLYEASRKKIDQISVFHEALKSKTGDMEDYSAFQELAFAPAPSLVKDYSDEEKVHLPQDYLPLSLSLEKVMKSRRSEREYSGQPLTLRELSTLLYFSYGIRGYIPAYNVQRFPLRMAPSSGGLQAIELYMTVNKVDDLRKGIYHYSPSNHSLELIYEGNFRRKMVNICIWQEFIHDASVIIILSCVLERLLWKYGPRAYRYIHMDAGFVAENIYLVAAALRLGACAIAGFSEDKINDLLRIDDTDEFVTLLMAIGKPKERKKT